MREKEEEGGEGERGPQGCCEMQVENFQENEAKRSEGNAVPEKRVAPEVYVQSETAGTLSGHSEEANLAKR
jgi:hypothetical protein